MRIFHCDHCEHLVFFENVQCVACSHRLAYLPDLSEVGSLEPAGDDLWKAIAPAASAQLYRLCQNYSQENVCNWAVPADDPDLYCTACRLTRVIPTLDRDGRREAWFALEAAKRRLVYSLLALGLPAASKTEEPERGLAFEFLADPDPGVVNADSLHLETFHALFGNESEDYASALERHYQNGPPSEWRSRFVSAYASSHAWEDWAETWAHYLHMTDTLETATECGLALLPNRHNERPVRPRFSLRKPEATNFDEMMANWFAVTYLLNNLNRGLGLKDSYPFVLSTPLIEKLRFVHAVCTVESTPADKYSEDVKLYRRPFLGTITGAALGAVAIGIWAATFNPHGGSEYSWYLFPISRLILNWLYPHQSISPLVWFGGAWLQWLLLGVVVDVARKIDHVRKQTRK